MIRTCEACTSPVTRQFARVFGDNDGRIHACPACVDMATVARGAGAGLAVEQTAEGPTI
jgi:hypothetical protein